MVDFSDFLDDMAVFMEGRKLAVLRWATCGGAFGGAALDAGAEAGVGVGRESPAELVFCPAPHAAIPRTSGKATTAVATHERDLTIFPPNG
jgi:hypothetical protein